MRSIGQRGIARKTLLIALVSALVLVGSGWWVFGLATRSNGPLPADIAGQLDFSPFVVSGAAKGYSQTSFKYATVSGSEEKVLSFIITLPSGTTVTASEYPQPPQFNDVQDFKTKFLENKSEDTVISDNGTIYLSHPEKSPNTQIGLMLEKGLIVFFNPTKNIDKTEWRALGNNLMVQHTGNS